MSAHRGRRGGAALTCCVGLLASCGQLPGQDKSAQGPERFVEVTADWGVDFVHETGARGGLLLPEVMGGGVALFDSDGDGRLDLYFVNSGDHPTAAVRASKGENRLYRQVEPGRFVDATAESGLGDTGYGMGVAVGDIDNDGDLDVYVTNLGPDQLYRNRGDGTFERVTEAAGIRVDGWSCSAAFFDANRDGALDLYVTQYVAFNPTQRCFDASGRVIYCSPMAFRPVSDVLLLNRGDGTFEDRSAAAGLTAATGAGLGVVVEDLDLDGWPDVYVANDGSANHLWINQKDGTFRDVAAAWGVACNLYGRAEAGMGVIAADLRNTGLQDLFSTHLENESNTLYRNGGAGRGFHDATGPSGLGFSSMPRTGFGVAAFDATLDGLLDLLVVNGRVVSGPPLPGARQAPPWSEYAEPNLFYRNVGDGRFQQLNDTVAAVCAPLDVSRGLVAGDLDGDGLQDLVVANLEDRPRVFLNRSNREGRWLSVRAVDPRLGRDAVGARVFVQAGERRLSRTVSGAGGYLSAGDGRAHFGLGPCDSIEFVEVLWPDGRRERFTGVEPDQAVELRRGDGQEEA